MKHVSKKTVSLVVLGISFIVIYLSLVETYDDISPNHKNKINSNNNNDKNNNNLATLPEDRRKNYETRKFNLSLLLEAQRDHVISRSYDGPISLKGCYVFLNETTEARNRKLAPLKYFYSSRCERRLPSVFLIGVKKSGTTTLAKYLDLHSQIALANYAPIPLTNSSEMADKIRSYILSMPYATPYQVVIANYPGYYWLNRISLFRLFPYLAEEPKILVILRNPVERALSDYTHMYDTGQNISDEKKLHLFQGDVMKPTFEETVLLPNGTINSSLSLIQKGLYAKYLSFFNAAIPRQNILILNGNKFSTSPLIYLKETERFLGLKPFYRDDHFLYNEERGFYCANVPSRSDITCMNKKYKGRKHPTVSGEVLKKLYDFYRPQNRKLMESYHLSTDEFEWILS